MKKTTIQERGALLPVGVEDPTSDVRSREYAFRRWNARLEIDIGKVRDLNRTITPAAFVTETLARVLSRWGAHVFDDKVDVANRLVILKRSFAADIYHAWLTLRRDVMGNEADIPLVCGACKHSFAYSVDLGSIEVTVIEDSDPLTVPIKFRDGLTYRGEDRKEALVGPIRWTIFEGFGEDSGMNVGAVKVAIIEGAIVAIPGIGDVRLAPGAADDLSKYDLEHAASDIDAVQPGPNLAVEVPCPKCRTIQRRPINWTYDSFFSAGSSRSAVPTESEGRSSSSPTASQGSPTL